MFNQCSQNQSPMNFRTTSRELKQLLLATLNPIDIFCILTRNIYTIVIGLNFGTNYIFHHLYWWYEYFMRKSCMVHCYELDMTKNPIYARKLLDLMVEELNNVD